MRYRRRLSKQPGEMNITAFMNLMVILVPFLLITGSVFPHDHPGAESSARVHGQQ